MDIDRRLDRRRAEGEPASAEGPGRTRKAPPPGAVEELLLLRVRHAAADTESTPAGGDITDKARVNPSAGE